MVAFGLEQWTSACRRSFVEGGLRQGEPVTLIFGLPLLGRRSLPFGRSHGGDKIKIKLGVKPKLYGYLSDGPQLFMLVF
jgi:hypothetical protein